MSVFVPMSSATIEMRSPSSFAMIARPASVEPPTRIAESRLSRGPP